MWSKNSCGFTKVGESDVRRVIPKPHTPDACYAILLTLNTELVEIGVGPPHSDLQDVVQIGDGALTAHEQTAPDHRADAQQNHFALVDGTICRERHEGMLPGLPLISHTFSQSPCRVDRQPGHQQAFLQEAADAVDEAGAHLLLQTRVKTLNQELGAVFRRWYPDLPLEGEFLAA